MRALKLGAAVLVVAAVIASVAVIRTNAAWPTPLLKSGEDHFLYGSIGAELTPLPVFQVLPDLFPKSFQPGGASAGDWIEQFGFIRLDEGANNGLPLGFTVSKYLPKSGTRSPVSFVGFTCAACHTARVRRSDAEPGVVVSGMGSPSLDLVPFGDAVKSSVLDEQRLTVDTIDAAYRARFQKSLGLVDRIVIRLWLNAARKQIREEIPMRGTPFSGADLRRPDLFASGPARIMAPRETVRRLIGQTPIPDGGPSKFPDLYEQGRREWAQFDGSVRDPFARNSIAAMGVGATVDNLKVPGILENIRESYSYVKTLPGPKFSEVFSGPEGIPDAARAARGKDVYDAHCSECHGAPGNTQGEWKPGTRLGQVIPVAEVGTDASRVSVRFYPQLADLIVDYFPDGHPLKPKREDLRATGGYITAPLESAFSRAPFLHNASVPTLAELINLKPRRAIYYRGANLWDPVDVGLVVTDAPDTKRYYRYNAASPGNDNRGHDYPWAYQSPGWDPEALRNLLEYLKTM